MGAPCKTTGCTGVIEEAPDFAALVDRLPERMVCPMRFDFLGGVIPAALVGIPGVDCWEKFKAPPGNRVCSYCGSLHPDDMIALVKVSANAPIDAEYRSVVEIETTDTDYKIYIHQPGVRNASEGGIKFYMLHIKRTPDGKSDISSEHYMEYGQALYNSQRRLDNWIKQRALDTVKTLAASLRPDAVQ